MYVPRQRLFVQPLVRAKDRALLAADHLQCRLYILCEKGMANVATACLYMHCKMHGTLI